MGRDQAKHAEPRQPDAGGGRAWIQACGRSSRCPRAVLGIVAAAAAWLAGCATAPAPAPAQAVPSYLLAPTGCAVVAGGDIGSRFTDPQVAATWARINSAITTELHDRLVLHKYKAIKLLVPAGGDGKAEDRVFESLAHHRCNRVLQVSHKVDEDASGKYFRFDVAVFRAQPKEGAAPSGAAVTVVAAGEYQRSYRHPRTQASFESFYTGTFADQVLADLVAAGALAPLR